MVGVLQNINQTGPVLDQGFPEDDAPDPNAIGTAKEEPKDLAGALAMASGLGPQYISAFRQTRQRNIADLQKLYEQQAQALRQQRVGMTKTERLMETLAAFGQPVSGGMGEALANAARVTVARSAEERAAERERQQKLLELEMRQREALLKAGQDYDLAEFKAYGQAAKGAQPKLKYASTVQVGGRNVTIMYDDTSGKTYYSVPEGTLPEQVPQLSAMLKAEPLGAPAAGAARPGVAAPAVPDAAAPGRPKWMDYIGQTITGEKARLAGLNPDDTYFVTEAGPGEPQKGTRRVSGEAALRASGGTYERGQMEGSKFVPYNEADRIPTATEFETNLKSLQSGINEQTTNLNEIRALTARLTPMTTGLIGSVVKYVPGAEALAVREQLQSAAGRLALDKLQELKRLSTTGASGLGATTERELKMLERAVASLDQAQSDRDLIAASNKIAKYYERVINSLAADGKRVAQRYNYVRKFYGDSAPQPRAQPEGREPKVLRYNPQTGGFE